MSDEAGQAGDEQSKAVLDKAMRGVRGQWGDITKQHPVIATKRPKMLTPKEMVERKRKKIEEINSR